MRPASGSVGAVSNGRSSGTREQIGIEVQVLGVGAVLGDRLKHHGSESITELPGLYSFAEAVHRAGDIPAVDTEHHGNRASDSGMLRPARVVMSTGFTPAAETAICTWPEVGAASGSCVVRKRSGGRKPRSLGHG